MQRAEGPDGRGQKRIGALWMLARINVNLYERDDIFFTRCILNWQGMTCPARLVLNERRKDVKIEEHFKRRNRNRNRNSN